ncbi:DinB family protein [Streptomyces sp. NBC_01506]|uniref:DinB family protein n=1 Tax=Streptomyces sp. NBC_01506 TaxID=2903887 RepID=UPI00386CD6E3
MIEPNPKADLLLYLQSARDTLLWKLDGLSEYDIRRPLTPTGTNLLGLVKHVAVVEFGYFGETFGRPVFDAADAADVPAWYGDGAEANADMWATADESRDEIVGLYHRAWEHSDSTVAALPLTAVGHVAWWPEERREVTLHRILIHVIADTTRHAGHADIVRELVDGAVGMREGNDNMPPGDRVWWESYRSQLEDVARVAGNG